MYFSKNNSFSHGVMFHHFHDKYNFKKSQGSISANQFKKIIKFIGKKNIISPNDFLDLVNKKKLKKKYCCITFDDSLKCQFKIALPVLEEFKIKAFFFIFSNSFSNNPDLVEVYRFFRTNYFKNIEDFYISYFDILYQLYSEEKITHFLKSKEKIFNVSKKLYPFYSSEDINFRIIRSYFLDQNKYKKIMLEMFKQKNFEYKKIFKKLFMSKNEIMKIHKLDHKIGLHTHSHKVNFKSLEYNAQLKEYKLNKKILENIIKVKIDSMSHPLGSYNKNTLKILDSLNIKLGFRDNMRKSNFMKKTNNTNFEIAREDHVNILKRI